MRHRVFGAEGGPCAHQQDENRSYSVHSTTAPIVHDTAQ